jgi:hypothetical protein
MIDPVRQPNEYQALLLSYLEDRDVREVFQQLPEQLRGVIDRAGEHLRTRPAEGEWSVMELVGHLMDAEIVVATRLRWILAQDEPPLPGYDQDDWVAKLRHNDGDPNEMVAVIEVLRRSNLGLWEAASEEDRARVGQHVERGPESFDLTFRLGAGHGLVHLEQMERTLEAVS